MVQAPHITYIAYIQTLDDYKEVVGSESLNNSAASGTIFDHIDLIENSYNAEMSLAFDEYGRPFIILRVS